LKNAYAPVRLNYNVFVKLFMALYMWNNGENWYPRPSKLVSPSESSRSLP